MSCRVFSRRIEHYLIDFLIKKLKEQKCTFIAFKIEITNKNLYLQNFIKELGIKLDKKDANYLINFKKVMNYKKNYILKVK